MAIDLKQFHQVFFEESFEGLDVMEQNLLEINDGGGDSETINSIFRAAHSIKGGSGTFGFSEVADFTHILETLLDEVRDGKRELTDESIDLLLKSCDCLRDMISELQAEAPVNNEYAVQLSSAFQKMLDEGNDSVAEDSASPIAEPASNTDIDEPLASGSATDIMQSEFDVLVNGGDNSPPVQNSGDGGGSPAWIIEFKPEPQVLMTGNEPIRLFRELDDLGSLEVEADTSRLPELAHLVVDECYLSWTLRLSGDVSREDIEEVFEWVIDECELTIRREDGAATQADSESKMEPEAEVVTQSEVESQQPVSVSSAPAVASEPAPAPSVSSATLVEPKPEPAETKSVSVPATTQKTPEKPVKETPATSSSSIRVGIDKVDNLINLVGELVITQSMLSELGNNFEMHKLELLSQGLEQLLQNTKELQESVMRIRMLPISFAFNRFPRMIRDLAQKTGKKVDLQIHGEQTELDKTVMEKISDPLVHLVRNAIDHGIEPAEARLEAGKSEQGVIRLDAYHQGGNIVIEIADDGKGLDAPMLKAKAVEKGLISAEDVLTDAEVFDLIFAPGFSTAKEVSDISGRGVGMDVVKRNIKALGGRIAIDSTIGVGTTFKVHLPLTLAILDGQLVRVGSEVYVIPLLTIVESLQVQPELVNKVSGDMVLYRLREDNVPIIPLYKEFDIETDQRELADSLLVVVEGEGQKVGLMVDDLLAQQQVVIKSLESNYKRVEGISGATILGDGSVSMILDIPGLIARASRRSRNRKNLAA